MKQDIDVGMRCIKIMLFTTNFMFALIGFLLISVGSTITSIYSDFELFMTANFFSPAALLIATGVITVCVAVFGCFAAIRKSTCLVNCYGVLLSMVVILELAAAITAYSMRGNITDVVENEMYDLMQVYKTDDRAKESWDFLQAHLECCGIRNPENWEEYDMKIPPSCYMENVTTHAPGTLPNVYEKGCLPKLSYIISECAGLIGTGLCVVVVQILGVIFAFMLAKSIRRLKTAAEVQRQENQRFYAQLARGTSEKPTPVLYTPNATEA